MEAKPEEIFDVLYVMDRQGVMDKFLAAFNAGLETAMRENDLSMWEILNMMDEIEDKTLMKGNQSILKYSGYLKWSKNRVLVKLLSRMLDYPFVQKQIAKRVNKLVVENMGSDARADLAM